jgi:hypothetical protein
VSLGWCAACASLTGGPLRVLRWPDAVVPPGATEVRYELAVWARDGGVPTERLLHRRGVVGTALRVDATGWPADICFSVRVHWVERGERRQSAWLAAVGSAASGTLADGADAAGGPGAPRGN